MHRTLIHIFLDPDIYRRVIVLRLWQICSGCFLYMHGEPSFYVLRWRAHGMCSN